MDLKYFESIYPQSYTSYFFFVILVGIIISIIFDIFYKKYKRRIYLFNILSVFGLIFALLAFAGLIAYDIYFINKVESDWQKPFDKSFAKYIKQLPSTEKYIDDIIFHYRDADYSTKADVRFIAIDEGFLYSEENTEKSSRSIKINFFIYLYEEYYEESKKLIGRVKFSKDINKPYVSYKKLEQNYNFENVNKLSICEIDKSLWYDVVLYLPDTKFYKDMVKKYGWTEFNVILF